MNDGHTDITNQSNVKWYVTHSYLKNVGNVVLQDTMYADYNDSIIMDSINAICKSGIRAKYVDGKYYNARTFTYQGTLVRAGEEISEIDGIEINSFIQANYDQMFYLKWDPNNKMWYSDFFQLAMPLLKQSVFTLKIGGRDVIINSLETVDNLEREKYQTSSSPKVMLLYDDMLYIYMPMMMNTQWYVDEIKKIYHAGVKKIILDVRGNAGGDDSVMAGILSALIDKPLTYRYLVGMNYNEALKEAISQFGTVEINDNEMTLFRERIIKPDSTSVNFEGRIYVFQNKTTFSAASALTSVAMQDKNRFTVVGEKSSFISGYTFPAVLLKLKNSGIVFGLAFSKDLTGGEQNKFMDTVDIEIQEDINDYLDMLFKYDAHSIEYLRQYDKFVKIVYAL